MWAVSTDANQRPSQERIWRAIDGGLCSMDVLYISKLEDSTVGL